MKIPSRIRITGRVSYEVLYSDVIKNDPHCMGMCDPNTRQIIIKNGMSEAKQIKTLVHELLHSIEFESKTPIPHKVTYALEAGIYKVLKLNKII